MMSTGGPRDPMSTGGPRSPPRGPGAGAVVRGVGAPAPRPGGPPPPRGPPTSFKPPPVAPPPRAVTSIGRPDVDKIKPIQGIARGPPPPRGLPGDMTPIPSAMGAPPMPNNLPPRGLPPRALANDFKATEYEGEKTGPITAGTGRNAVSSVAGEKPSARGAGSTRKAGAIEMFDESVTQAAAGGSEPKRAKTGAAVPFNPGMVVQTGKKAPPGVLGAPRKPTADPTTGEVIRTTRPGAPDTRPAGIPDDSALPPDEKPKDKKNAPPPVRQVPDRGRAPPRVEVGVKEKAPDPKAPDPETAPSKRGKVIVEEEIVYVSRRDRENPEFESSSDEDETEEEKIKKYEKKQKQIQKEKRAALNGLPKPNADATPPPKEILTVTASAAEVAEDKKAKADMAKSMGKDVPVEMEMDVVQEAKPEVDPNAAPIIELDDDEPAPPMNIPASMGVAMATSAFVPPPPEEYRPEFDTSKVAQELTPGRLSIRCIEGINVRRKDEVNKIPKQDPFLKLKLGSAERHPYKTSKIQRKSDDNPNFQNEIIYFDILDPSTFVMNGDLQLVIECWNKGTFKDEPMGAITLSVVRFCKMPFMAYEEKLPLLYPGQKTSTSKIVVEIVFEEARPGIFSFKLYDAKSLRNVDPMGQQHPFIKFKLGPLYEKRSKTIKNGGTNPYFAEEEVLMWADRESWKDDLQIMVLDEDLGDDKPIGVTSMCLLPYMDTTPQMAKEDFYDMFYTVVDPKDDRIRTEYSQGQLQMKVTYYPAGKLILTIDRARGLMFPETHVIPDGQSIRMDPYVNLTAESKAVQTIKRTAADKDGGVDPVWQSEIMFDVVDQYQINIDVINQAMAGQDVLLGNVMLSLLPTFRSGKTEQWLTLKQKKANGGIKEVGAIYVIAEFTGPTGIAFPQLNKEVDSFDDTVRALATAKPDEDEQDKVIVKDPYPTLPEEDKVERSLEPDKNEMGEDIIKQEFQDHEILAAFKFIDLDHNNFIGAKEIRHILVCMGEMITDEEIDMMIKMVDMDGDGQVSFQEFRTLVLHPDPGLVDMHKEVNNERDNAQSKEQQLASGKAKATDLTSFQRMRELTSREAKKAALILFIADNEINFDFIKQSYQIYLELPRERRPGGRVNFNTFCECFGLEPLTQFKMLHELFDNEEMGDVDFREVLLSAMNFVDLDREERIQFSFIMFDELKTGYISHKEVEEILRGNHMIGILSVQRKADTVMRQASKNASGSITMNEFVVVSKKFPNIMLPNIGAGKKK